MSSIVAVGSGLDNRAEDNELCRVIDFRCKVLLRSARNSGCTLRLGFGEVGILGLIGGGSDISACISLILSFRLGLVGGGAFFKDDFDHV